jgi:hypothetical protein
MELAEVNPPITPLLRMVTLVEMLVLAVAGAGLLFLPELTRAAWPWQLTPFNTGFLGAVYLGALASIALMGLVGRWAPARPVLPTICIFTAIVLAVSLVYLDRFDARKWSSWAWFGLYIALPVNAAYHLWLYRHQPPAQPAPVPAAWRALLLVVGGVLGLYGIGLLGAPEVFSAFWPWRLDAFHGQLYSATLSVARRGC